MRLHTLTLGSVSRGARPYILLVKHGEIKGPLKAVYVTKSSSGVNKPWNFLYLLNKAQCLVGAMLEILKAYRPGLELYIENLDIPSRSSLNFRLLLPTSSPGRFCILSLYIIYDWITIMGYSKHELSTINV